MKLNWYTLSFPYPERPYNLPEFLSTVKIDKSVIGDTIVIESVVPFLKSTIFNFVEPVLNIYNFEVESS